MGEGGGAAPRAHPPPSFQPCLRLSPALPGAAQLVLACAYAEGGRCARRCAVICVTPAPATVSSCSCSVLMSVPGGSFAPSPVLPTSDWPPFDFSASSRK